MVIIKGMEIPKCCLECNFSYYDDFNELACKICEKDIFGGKQRQDYCPLISADSVIEQMEATKIVKPQSENGFTYNYGIDACISILRGLKE